MDTIDLILWIFAAIAFGIATIDVGMPARARQINWIALGLLLLVLVHIHDYAQTH
jgi:hypothetical protein